MVFSFDQYRPTQAFIHLDRLRHNVGVLQNLVPSSSFFCPMVKANAYGHGDTEVALALEQEGVRAMGVGLIEEGMLLRGLGVKAQLLFFGLMDVAGAQACLEGDLTPVLSSWEQMHALLKVIPHGKQVSAHLKFDTGMHRLGFEPSEADALFDFFTRYPQIQLTGLMTHLHTGEDAMDPQGESFGQIRQFEQITAPFHKWTTNTHILNSAGLLSFARLRQQGQIVHEGVSLMHGSRPGLALYGVSPLAGFADLAPLQPVMSLRSQVIRLKKIEPGQGVSYNHRWRAARTSTIGVVPMGYADGYHRLLGNHAEVLIEGVRAPVIGNVCMDYFMIDLTDLATTRGSATSLLWKEVTMFGTDSKGQLLPVEELAERAQTIPWEILTSVSERVPRRFEGKERK